MAEMAVKVGEGHVVLVVIFECFRMRRFLHPDKAKKIYVCVSGFPTLPGFLPRPFYCEL